ncbi:MAG: HEAT repeat domain-containing protein [Deltaproteobacteria bacterium]|jgi:HEAT repeat protein|nr:HEAT repeat domain-containing protein [Deltaproteobacteria bacterium]MCK9502517.1 HEAT repeat domain-containing protein [Lascolabacillus sp.]
MHPKLEKQFRERAVALGNSGDPAALPELVELTRSPVANVRRLAASAIGKLAGLADGNCAVAALQEILRDGFPQVRQYAAKALSAYGTAAKGALPDLRDMAISPVEKEYNNEAARCAIALIEEACRIEEEKAVHSCQRCGVGLEPDEYIRSHKAFQRPFCNYCFDEVFLERRNFETKVELQKNIRAKDGTWVQSEGERLICEALNGAGIRYRYDERFRILDGYAIRPDFYLPEFDVYVEYWGMDTADYKIGMLKKQQLYQQQEKRLVSLYPDDKPRMRERLLAKLGKYR